MLETKVENEKVSWNEIMSRFIKTDNYIEQIGISEGLRKLLK
ncbi:MAG: hypothetical protein ABIC04_06595 [Nanoarchaeota archaeon]